MRYAYAKRKKKNHVQRSSVCVCVCANNGMLSSSYSVWLHIAKNKLHLSDELAWL